MSSYIQNIKTESGDTIYPITSTKAVFNEDGQPIDSAIEEVKTTINETVSGIPSQLQEVQETINSSLGSADIASIGDGTIKGAILAMQQNYENKINELTNSLTEFQTRINNDLNEGIMPKELDFEKAISFIDTLTYTTTADGLCKARVVGGVNCKLLIDGKVITSSVLSGLTWESSNSTSLIDDIPVKKGHTITVTSPVGWSNFKGSLVFIPYKGQI